MSSLGLAVLCWKRSFKPLGGTTLRAPVVPYRPTTTVAAPAVVVTDGATTCFVEVLRRPLCARTGAVGSMPAYAAIPPAALRAVPNCQVYEGGSAWAATWT